MLGAVTAVFVIPIIILNSLAGLVGGAWLLWLGGWRLVLGGFVVVIAAPVWASLLMLPGLLAGGPALMALDRGYSRTGAFLAALAGLWTYAVVTAWCILAFWYVPHFWHPGEPLVPFFLYAYAMATGPWAVMAQRESRGGGGEAAQLTLSCACVGSALVLGYVLLASRPILLTAVWLVVIPMVLGFILSIVIAMTENRANSRYRVS